MGGGASPGVEVRPLCGEDLDAVLKLTDAVAAEGRWIGREAPIDRAIAWARGQGAHKVALQVWPHNEPARRLYERSGFVVEGRLRRHYRRRDGSLWDAVVMGLLLDTR